MRRAGPPRAALFRYNGLARRPRVQPGTLVLCGVCQTPHALTPGPAAPTPWLLYYFCASRPTRPPTATPARHLGALGGWLMDGLAPLPSPDNGAAPLPTVPGTHTHVCPACARIWPHPERDCRPLGMRPKRCARCQARLATTLVRWAHVVPEDGAATRARPPDPLRPSGPRGPSRRRRPPARSPIRQVAPTPHSGDAPR